MARRRRGRPLDGWLVIDKPLGMGSTQAMAMARRALGAQKAGHAGTLDPLATGVLAVAFGEATKTVALAQEGRKTYRFTVRLGQATATDDAEGEVIAGSPLRPTDAQIEAVLPRFRGRIAQVPPAFSAVKVAGARAYDLARSGEAPTLAARPLEVHRLELVARPDADHAEFEMVCGKGGYVRSIARDIGAALGCHGHVSALRRTASGGFALAQAVPPDALGPGTPLLPVAAGLAGVPCVAVGAADAARLRRGMAVPVPPGEAPEGVAWAACAGQPVAIGRIAGGHFRPSRVIAPPQEAAAGDRAE